MLTDRQMEYYVALDTLLKAQGFFEELENANYHSAYEFLKEIRDRGYYKRWDDPRPDEEGWDGD